MKRKWKLVLQHLSIALCCVLVFYLFDFQCVFRSITGIPCPGCGLTRSVLALLRFDFAKSLYFHPMGAVLPPLLFYIFHVEKLWSASHKTVRAVEITTGLLLFGTYVVRLLFHAIP